MLNKKDLHLIKDIDLAELCITSTAVVEESKNNSIQVLTKKAEGTKCPVCWKISLKTCVRHNA